MFATNIQNVISPSQIQLCLSFSHPPTTFIVVVARVNEYKCHQDSEVQSTLITSYEASVYLVNALFTSSSSSTLLSHHCPSHCLTNITSLLLRICQLNKSSLILISSFFRRIIEAYEQLTSSSVACASFACKRFILMCVCAVLFSSLIICTFFK